MVWAERQAAPGLGALQARAELQNSFKQKQMWSNLCFWRIILAILYDEGPAWVRETFGDERW